MNSSNMRKVKTSSTKNPPPSAPTPPTKLPPLKKILIPSPATTFLKFLTPSQAGGKGACHVQQKVRKKKRPASMIIFSTVSQKR